MLVFHGRTQEQKRRETSKQGSDICKPIPSSSLMEIMLRRVCSDESNRSHLLHTAYCRGG